MVLTIAVGGILGSYVHTINDLSIQGYSIREREGKMAVLKEENRKLQVEAIQLQSLQGIEKNFGGLGMVPIEERHYISDTSSVVATR